MEQNRHIQRLLFWNRAWLTLFCTGLMAWGLCFYVAGIQQDIRNLTACWYKGGVKFRVLTDGPLVVTHLVNYGPGEGRKSWTALSPPIAIIDSYGAYLDAAQIKKYDWRYYTGEQAPAPTEGTEISVLYYHPDTAKWRHETTAEN